MTAAPGFTTQIRDVEVWGKQDVPEYRPVGWGWTVVRGRGLSHCQCDRKRDRGAQARQIRPFPPSIERSASQASSSTSRAATAAAPRSCTATVTTASPRRVREIPRFAIPTGSGSTFVLFPEGGGAEPGAPTRRGGSSLQESRETAPSLRAAAGVVRLCAMPPPSPRAPGDYVGPRPRAAPNNETWATWPSAPGVIPFLKAGALTSPPAWRRRGRPTRRGPPSSRSLPRGTWPGRP